MRRIRILSAPPAIAIDEEPLGVDPGDLPPVSAAGFELVPAWQARRARWRRHALATLPVLAVAAAVALSVSTCERLAVVSLSPGVAGGLSR